MTVATYRTVSTEVTAEIEVKRSRFIGVLAPARDEDAARSVIARLRREHHGARHCCSAFVIGPDGRLARSNDDGEPAGTAGAPILETVRGADLSDVVAVVVRYFGGTLLGAGGLVRAYGDAITAALPLATVIHREQFDLFDLPVEHAVAGRVEAELRNRNVLVRSVDYRDLAVLRLAVPPAGAATLAELVAAVTTGAGELTATGHEWVDRP